MATSYDDQSVDALKDELRKRDLPVSGNKNDLVKRLKDADRAAAKDKQNDGGGTEGGTGGDGGGTSTPPQATPTQSDETNKEVEELRAQLADTQRQLAAALEGSGQLADDIELGAEGGPKAEDTAIDYELMRREQEQEVGLTTPPTGKEAQGASPMEAAMQARSREGGDQIAPTKVHGTGVHALAEPAPAHATGQGEHPHRHIAEHRTRSGIAAPAPTRFDGGDSQAVNQQAVPPAIDTDQAHAQDTSDS